MKFFFDNNLSPKLVDGLRGFGEKVIHLQELFPPDTPDTKWLRHVGEHRFILVTRDEKVRYRPGERGMLKEFNVGVFFLGGKSLSHCKLIQQTVRNWPRMKELAAKTHRPFAFRVPPSGVKISQIELG